MSYVCKVCGAISTQPHCPSHTPHKRTRGRKLQAIRTAVYHQQHGTCQTCGQTIPLSQARIDHTVALDNAGSDTQGNRQLLCQRCNQAKANT